MFLGVCYFAFCLFVIITRLLGLGVGWVGLVGLDLGFDVVVWLFVMLCFAGWCICLL